MADETLAHYTFVPWLRRGVASEIDEADDLGAGTGAALKGATLSIQAEIAATSLADAAVTPAPAISKTLRVLGPADVVGLRREAILRTHPPDGEPRFAPNGLACVELYEEDFPWRYTPARPATAAEPADRRHKLRPWIVLWVLEPEEFSFGEERPDRPRTIRLAADRAAGALPPHGETWAWAHAQVSRALAAPGEVDGAVRNAPDHALSRLICPRRLEADKTYHAFIVPAFEVGRLAGLGEDTSAVPAQAPSWNAGAMPHSPVRPLEYPIYHHFTFRTGVFGDFESLVRALKPGPVGPEFGKRAVDVGAPGFGMDGAGGPAVVEVEGALKPFEFSPAPFPATPGAPFIDRLEAILDLSEDLEAGRAIALTHPYHVPGAAGAYGAHVPDDPIVTPPVYGKWHADVARLADARGDAARAWLRELNLDPRERSAAGVGVEVVQERQEELVERAWQQVGALDQANARLREAELAVAVSEVVFDKHVGRAAPDRALLLTAAAHRRTLGTGASTVRAEIEGSQVPAAAPSAAFKRITRPQRKAIRRLSGSGSVEGFHRDLVTNMNDAAAPLSAAPPSPEPGMTLAMSTVSAAVQASVEEIATDGGRPHHVFLELLAHELRARADAGENLNALSLPAVRTSLRARLDAEIPVGSPAEDIARKAVVQQLIAGIVRIQSPAAGAAQAEIPEALFDATFGESIAGKSYGGVTVIREGTAPAAEEIARMTAMVEVEEYQSQLSSFNTSVVHGRVEPPPPPRLGGVPALAIATVTSLRPKTTLAMRVLHTLSGIAAPPADEPRRLRPVMAHPTFPDPMFEDLRRRSQDFVLPNYSDLPQDTITLLEPNQRFIEAYMAGLNEEMARELLWREYPTDLRGTYFQKFWDTRDDVFGAARPDIKKMHLWSGALGGQSERAGGYLVLVIRGELLKKYPSTVVYAQRAVFDPADANAPRTLADDADPANLRFPAFHGRLDPDISLFGFALSKDEAKGRRPAGPADPLPADPGWFFVLKERPGEVRFGLDDPVGGVPALASWDDLSWAHLVFPASSPRHVAVGDNHPVLDGSAGASDPTAATWGKSSADLAYIFFQSPVLYARHAEELLP